MSRDRKSTLLLLGTLFAIAFYYSDQFLHPAPTKILSTGHRITPVHFSPDGEWLVTFTSTPSKAKQIDDRSVDLWNVETGQRTATYNQNKTVAIGFSENSKAWLLFTFSRYQLTGVIVHNLETGKLIQPDLKSAIPGDVSLSTARSADGRIDSELFRLDPLGSRLLKQPIGRSGQAFILDLENPSQHTPLESSTGKYVIPLSFTPDGMRIVGVRAFDGQHLEVWDARTGERLDPVPLGVKLEGYFETRWRDAETLSLTKKLIRGNSELTRYLVNCRTGATQKLSFDSYAVVATDSDHYALSRVSTHNPNVATGHDSWEHVVGARSEAGDLPIGADSTGTNLPTACWIAEQDGHVVGAWESGDSEEWLPKLAFEYRFLEKFITRRSFLTIKSWRRIGDPSLNKWKLDSQTRLDTATDQGFSVSRLGRRNGKIVAAVPSLKIPNAVEIYAYPITISWQRRTVAAISVVGIALVGMLFLWLLRKLLPSKPEPAEPVPPTEEHEIVAQVYEV